MDPPPRIRIKQKRRITFAFASQERAAAYLNRFARYPVEQWPELIAQNNRLSIKDIRMLCNANAKLNELCERGEIYNAIFVRQFGEEWFRKVVNATGGMNPYYPGNEKRNALNRLIAARLNKTLGNLIYSDDAVNFERKDSMSMVIIHWSEYDDYENPDYPDDRFLIISSPNDPVIINDLYQATSLRDAGFMLTPDQTRMVWRVEDMETSEEDVAASDAASERIELYFIHLYVALLQRGYRFTGFDDPEMPYTDVTVGRCVVCNHGATVRCGGTCGSEQYYCGSDCAIKHWNNGHKYECN